MKALVPRKIWMWRAAHEEWRSTSELVGSYAVLTGGGLAIVDPLLPAGRADEVMQQLSQLHGSEKVAVFVTIPYHVRDSEEVAEILGARIVGHKNVADRLNNPKLLIDVTRESKLPLGAQAISVGKPARAEHPIYFPDVKALAVGDLIVSIPDGVRIWSSSGDLNTDAKRTSHWDRLVPAVTAALGDLDIDHILTTHGEPVIGGGSAALREGLAAEPTAYRVGDMAGSVRPG
jgi:hypothetical protein